jgi:ribosome-associated heat shock protein Hsp15
VDAARVDRWLWAVRLVKTRSAATSACRAGHVRVGGRPAKAATTVKVGDVVEARLHGIDRTVEVARVIENRVGAAIAVECYVDHTPPPPPEGTLPPVAVRERGAGRPTKRDRRRIEQLRGDR